MICVIQLPTIGRLHALVRNGVALVYTLDKVEYDCMELQVDESLASLRRLYESKT